MSARDRPSEHVPSVIVVRGFRRCGASFQFSLGSLTWAVLGAGLWMYLVFILGAAGFNLGLFLSALMVFCISFSSRPRWWIGVPGILIAVVSPLISCYMFDYSLERTPGLMLGDFLGHMAFWTGFIALEFLILALVNPIRAPFQSPWSYVLLVGQLPLVMVAYAYAAGALILACIGLNCPIPNDPVLRALF